MTSAAMVSCSEDSLTADPSLSETIYDREGDDAGALGAQINDFYDKYGAKILYKFNASDLNFDWSSIDAKWYTPADQSGDYISRMITYLDETALADYPAAFVKKFLPYRIFLVDSLCDRSEYNEDYLTDYLELDTHGIAIAKVGPRMDEMSDDDWSTLKESVNTSLMNSILATTGVEPTEFQALNEATFMIDYLEDPEGEFSAEEYSCFSATLVGATIMEFWGEVYIMAPSDQQDFGYYVAYIMNNTKSKLDRVFARFPIVKRRAALVYEFMLDNADTDLIEFQNQACPSDPLPLGYFSK